MCTSKIDDVNSEVLLCAVEKRLADRGWWKSDFGAWVPPEDLSSRRDVLRRIWKFFTAVTIATTLSPQLMACADHQEPPPAVVQTTTPDASRVRAMCADAGLARIRLRALCPG